LRTQELEERCARLEHALEMANLEGRVQQGYIANLKVYESVVNGYILQLKGRLYELDPRSRLLECRIPAMPEKRDDMEIDGGLILLSEVVDGISCLDYVNSDMPVVEMDVDPPEGR
jgi:hypothetical protein